MVSYAWGATVDALEKTRRLKARGIRDKIGKRTHA